MGIQLQVLAALCCGNTMEPRAPLYILRDRGSVNSKRSRWIEFALTAHRHLSRPSSPWTLCRSARSGRGVPVACPKAAACRHLLAADSTRLLTGTMPKSTTTVCPS